MPQVLDLVHWVPRLWSQTLSVFGVLALLMSAMGVYAVTAYDGLAGRHVDASSTGRDVVVQGAVDLDRSFEHPSICCEARAGAQRAESAIAAIAAAAAFLVGTRIGICLLPALTPLAVQLGRCNPIEFR